MCPPGTYVFKPCSKTSKTVCKPCVDGFFSNEYTFFDRCEECRSCQHVYAEKCTLTTDAKCSCPHGFLCSDGVCSACVENKNVTGEELTTTVMMHSKGGDPIHVIVYISFLLVSLSLLVFLISVSIKKLRRIKATQVRCQNHVLRNVAGLNEC
ncbi:hypothetical protein INR49_031289 [Caranx melampygus]|nr:hypothetical protein INR49_031289 [Caranx melampygus]